MRLINSEIQVRRGKWTADEERELQARFVRGDKLSDIANFLGRPLRACDGRLQTLKIRRGEGCDRRLRSTIDAKQNTDPVVDAPSAGKQPVRKRRDYRSRDKTSRDIIG